MRGMNSIENKLRPVAVSASWPGRSSNGARIEKTIAVRLQCADLGGARTADLHEDISAGEGRGGVCDYCAGFGVGRVGEARFQPGARLDAHSAAEAVSFFAVSGESATRLWLALRPLRQS